MESPEKNHKLVEKNANKHAKAEACFTHSVAVSELQGACDP